MARTASPSGWWAALALIIGSTAEATQKSTIGDKTYTVLMDAGPESKSIARNAKAMAVPLDELDAIVLSHWHADRASCPLLFLTTPTRRTRTASACPGRDKRGPEN